MTHKKIVLLLSTVLIVGSIFGCAHTAPNSKSVCSNLATPNSHKVYLFVSNKYNSSEKIVRALKNNTTYALLQQIEDVKLTNNIKTIGSDGVLLHIDIIGSLHSGLSKRIDIRYKIINNATKEVMIKGKEAIGSKFGYNKITVALGKRIAAKVNNLFSCFDNHIKE